jgi:poly(beta-D-mannuronate) lyase
MKFSAAVALSVVALWSASSFAAEVKVADPKELSKALEGAKPGDTIVLKAGVWKDSELVVVGKGTKESPITVRAERPGETVLSGESSLRIGGSFVIVDGLAFEDFLEKGHIVQFRVKDGENASDCRLTNCSIESYTGDPKVGSFWVSLYGQRNRVDHNFFRGKKSTSPTLVVWVEDKPNDHQIDHNHFAGRPRAPGDINGFETIRVGTSQVSMNVSRTVVEENLFEHCDGESEIISSKSCENIYRRNIFLESKGGLCLRHGNRNLVEGNIFYGNNVEGTGGIRVIGEDQRVIGNTMYQLGGAGFMAALTVMDGIPNSKPNEYFRVKRAVIANNRIIDCKESIIIGLGHGERNRIEAPDDLTLENNTVVSDSGPLVKMLSQPTGLVWKGNQFGGSAQAGIDLPAENKRVETAPDAAHVPPFVRPKDVGPQWKPQMR